MSNQPDWTLSREPNTKRRVIVSVPNGPMPQGETFGNPHEAHLWTFNGTEEFKDYDFKLIHQSVCTVVSIKGELS